MTLELGTTLGDGRFRLDAVLGEGATARVFRAHDLKLGVDRAIKVLFQQGSSRRFHNEVQALVRLRHPHILPIYDIGEHDGHSFLVMELAVGTPEQQGVVPVSRAVGWIIDVLGGLSVAHRAGIVHRDIKPANLLVDTEGRIYLADFGLAVLPEHSATLFAIGTPAFMAPEHRLDPEHAGPAADIYSVGATLYTLITGQNPVDLFTADADSPRWQGVPPSLRPVLLRATRAAAAERYIDAEAFRRALTDAWPGVRHVEAAPAAPTPAPRSYLVPIMVIGSLLSVVGVYLALGLAPPPQPSAAAETKAPKTHVEASEASPPAADTKPAPAEPAPAPAAPTPTAPRPDVITVSPVGVFRGTYGGEEATFRLSISKSGKVSGEVTVLFSGGGATSGVSRKVQGTWAPTSRTLRMSDTTSAGDTGTYLATLSADGERLTGHLLASQTGAQIPFSLVRER